MAAITQHPTAKTDFANPTTSQIIFIRKREVMRRTGLSSTGIYDLMARDLFPKSIKLAGGKAVAWLERYRAMAATMLSKPSTGRLSNDYPFFIA